MSWPRRVARVERWRLPDRRTATPGEADDFSRHRRPVDDPPGQDVTVGHAENHCAGPCGRVGTVIPCSGADADEECTRTGSSFVRFQGWPLWWRVGLEVHAAGLASLGVQEADPWSPDEACLHGGRRTNWQDRPGTGPATRPTASARVQTARGNVCARDVRTAMRLAEAIGPALRATSGQDGAHPEPRMPGPVACTGRCSSSDSGIGGDRAEQGGRDESGSGEDSSRGRGAPGPCRVGAPSRRSRCCRRTGTRCPPDEHRPRQTLRRAQRCGARRLAGDSGRKQRAVGTTLVASEG